MLSKVKENRKAALEYENGWQITNLDKDRDIAEEILDVVSDMKRTINVLEEAFAFEQAGQ